MPLSPEAAVEQARVVMAFRDAEKAKLDRIHDYYRGKQKTPIVPRGVPAEVQRLALMARVKVMKIVVSSLTQALYVDGYRQPREAEDAPAWAVWQANACDARQIGVHRAALIYGASYATVLPGRIWSREEKAFQPLPVIRSYSPRYMTALYGDDDYWPRWALHTGKDDMMRLFDDTSIYILKGAANPEFVQVLSHDIGHVPVVRFLNEIDLDEDNDGEVEPLIELQDQIDHTTFSLKVAEQYGAFRQRYAIGFTAPSEEELLKAAASRIWTFEDSPEDIKLGEFEQTQLAGYLESRESSLRHAATLSQTPVHELIGSMINLSAEALVAAEAGWRRKITERQMSFGESWEQVLALAGEIANFEVDDQAQVRWRDTESRALSATVDALGKMAQMLGIPPQELWERVPGTSQQDIERWKEAAASGDAMANLTQMLDRQMGAAPAGNGGAAA